MGTRSLDPADWFVVDDDWEPQRAEAARLVASDPAEVVVGVADPAVVGPSAELLALVQRLTPTGSGSPSVAPPTGSGSPSVARDEHPLVRARLLVADDLCLLLPDGVRWVLAAGCVCFPSYWRPRDKIGQPLSEVHGLVPGYPGALADRVDAFLGRLAPGRGVWRRNWLLHDVPDLHLPGPHATEGLPEPVGGATEGLPVPEGRWLRSERQVLLRLVEHDAVAFGIRTQQVPLAVLERRRDVAAGLAGALRGWSPAQHAYKGRAVDDALLAWLDAVR